MLAIDGVERRDRPDGSVSLAVHGMEFARAQGGRMRFGLDHKHEVAMEVRLAESQMAEIEALARGLAEIDWDDITEAAPAVVAAVTMPLTYSIATGIGLGFITYALAKIIAGKFAEAKPAVLVLAALFAIKFAIG